MNTMTMQLIMIVGLFAIMYFLLIRPQKKREKQVNEMRNSIKVGDDIVTIGGIYGKVVKVKEDRFTIQVGADKTKFDMAKWSISKVEKPAPDSKKKTVDDVEEEEQPKKISPKKLKKLGASDDTEAAETEENLTAEEPVKEETPLQEEVPVQEEALTPEAAPAEEKPAE